MTSYVGGCQCEFIRYELTGKLRMVYACHCHRCQKQSGSAFALAAVFDDAALTLTAGEFASYDRPGRSGRIIKGYFCPKCGSRIYHQWEDDGTDAPFINLKPGTLDDTSWIKPDYHVWMSSAQGWEAFHEGDVLYDELGGKM